MKKMIFWLLGILIMSSCSPVKVPLTNEYQLKAYSQKVWGKGPHATSILVTEPVAVAGYETEKMLYIKETFSLKSFANNAWVASPATMLYPLIIESLQASGRFGVVANTLYTEPVEYRLDTQLLKLQQNFQHKPSTLELSVKIVLTDVKEQKILVSRIFSESIPCTQDTPLGGVIAANRATEALTARITRFVVQNLNH